MTPGKKPSNQGRVKTVEEKKNMERRHEALLFIKFIWPQNL